MTATKTKTVGNSYCAIHYVSTSGKRIGKRILLLNFPANSLEVVSEPLHLVEHEVDVGLVDGLVGDDRAEEVGVHPERLVADHQGAGVHHPPLQLGRDLLATIIFD